MLLKHISDQSVCFLLSVVPKQLKKADQRGELALVALLFLPLRDHTSPTSAIFQFSIYSSLSLGNVLFLKLKFVYAVA
jgi:hypothetical protein